MLLDTTENLSECVCLGCHVVECAAYTHGFTSLLDLYAQLQGIEQVETKSYYDRLKQKALSRRTDMIFTMRDGVEDAFGVVTNLVVSVFLRILMAWH